MLTGDRVMLRPTRPEDLPKLYTWRIDLDNWLMGDMRAPRPTTFAQFEALYERLTRDDQDDTEWAIEGDGELVGRCGMFRFDHLSRHAEVGIALGPEHQGKHYGRDALTVLVNYGFAMQNLNRVHLETLASNEPGLRAYRAVGFVEEGRRRAHAWVNGRFEDAVVMGVLRSEWDTRG